MTGIAYAFFYRVASAYWYRLKFESVLGKAHHLLLDKLLTASATHTGASVQKIQELISSKGKMLKIGKPATKIAKARRIAVKTYPLDDQKEKLKGKSTISKTILGSVFTSCLLYTSPSPRDS
eukprot:TRINITY_DN8549_c0_g2_i2.p1 TRINITY_DN8549_c0_g2~~TRINITY_DN8549_c0_g2_i2.p1  ORF type:complete len:122 (+),score=20.84 TRINITY_DN8549_c0_g2_i2:115-480(+)